MKMRQEAAKLLVHGPSNSDGRALNELASSDLSVPVVKQTGRFPVQLGYVDPMPFRISGRVATKDRAGMAALAFFAHAIVEAR
jgi:hypothetical protein